MKKNDADHAQARKAYREYKQVRRDKSKAYYKNSWGYSPKKHLLELWAIRAEQAWS
jgi:hypothetical protein